MRRSRECEVKPSPRQGINMGKLLLPPYLRQGHLTFHDLINAAIITSHVESQPTAEKIAAEILTNLDPDEPLPDPGLDGDDFISLLQKASEEQVTVSPYGKGLENELGMAAQDSDFKFENYMNKPDIGVGPGEDEIIKTGIRYLKGIKKQEARKVLQELLKEKLLKLGREFERKEDWNKSRNLMPFQPGEDTDLIDEERSLDNILDLGRSIDDIRWDDFLMRQRQKQKRHIVFILDISNTMFYDLEGLNSITYSVMSMVPLIWGLRREKYALTLYESNSHVVKDFYEEVDMMPIAEDLINMMFCTTTEMEKRYCQGFTSMTWGGTVPGKSLKWAYDEITSINDRSDRMVFIFSDFVLTQPGENTPQNTENYEILQKMIDQGVRVCACVSPLARKSIFRPYTRQSLADMEKLGIFMANTYRPSDFLEQANEFISEG
ncbi:MAG: VWA domain-containing protein [Candidatus Bathyarchaeota archaeon]|nr:VWA domain-containing protein [Candidatus Bathyarchaeota archaeon]